MTDNRKSNFALYFGNRGFFPESLIDGARQELSAALKKLGHGVIMLDAAATRYGAVESPAEGAAYARFLKENEGKYDGVILCLPNFGDETGAIAALRDCGVPILIQAYPDELDKMGFSERRDAFCGKFSIMDVFCQYGLPFTALPPHTVHPGSAKFAEQIDIFDRACRVYKGMKRMIVGAIGARTTAFKTVRFDELTLQKYDITTEALDMSEVFARVKDYDKSKTEFKDRAESLKNYTRWDGIPGDKFDNLVKFSVVFDELVQEYQMDCVAIRCWIEMEKQFGVAPCVLISEMNHRGIPTACELDVCNAVPMYALSLASTKAATCLDWNNNYGGNENKCILFHCGPVAQSLMTAKGQVIDHPMFAKALGEGSGWGCNVGRIAPAPMTYCSSLTKNGELVFYLDEGRFTEDVIPPEFFGCAGVAEIAGLQDKLRKIGYAGYRHHVAVTSGHVAAAVREAFTNYLGYKMMDI